MQKLNLFITITALIALSATQTFAYFTIFNNSGVVAEIYLTAKAYSFVSPKSNGNLAYSFDGTLDPEGATRILQPGQATQYKWIDGRMGMCMEKLMVKFAGQSTFTSAIKDNEIRKGCQNLAISITQVDGKPHIEMKDLPPE